MDIRTRGTCGFFACLVAGAIATGPAAVADTNWGALSAAKWDGQPAEGPQKVIQPGTGANGDWSAAIERAFVELGMTPPRAECYGKVLSDKLSPEEQQAAVQLVGNAATADEVKLGVISGGPEMVGGFSAANVTCPESMGG